LATLASQRRHHYLANCPGQGTEGVVLHFHFNDLKHSSAFNAYPTEEKEKHEGAMLYLHPVANAGWQLAQAVVAGFEARELNPSTHLIRSQKISDMKDTYLESL
jgi:hypothetical protein